MCAMPVARDPARRAPLGERLNKAMLKPAPAAPQAPVAPPSIEELRNLAGSADDKERLIGLLAAPMAAGVAILVVTALVTNDPVAHLANGQINKLHVNPSIYHVLELVLLAMSVLMLVLAMLRKRLYLGIAMALYGLAIFNLHYWGFGIPFLLAGSWYLVRAYRLQRDLKQASGAGAPLPNRSGSAPARRYKPPLTAAARRSQRAANTRR